MSSDLFRKTLKTVGMMVGACVAFTGVVTLIALFAVGRAVGPRESGESTTLVPASKVQGGRPTDGAPGASPTRDDATPAPKSNANKADLPPRATRAI